MIDVPDCDGVQNIVFESGAQKRKPWTIKGQNFQQSFLYFVFNCLLVTALVTTSITILILADSCDERTMWYLVLTWCIGYVIPQPGP